MKEYIFLGEIYTPASFISLSIPVLQVIASATVFFKRFYAMNTLNCVDPLLLAPTCVFLSSKVRVFEVFFQTLFLACSG